jgi:drug/metabolite transporter (DMT)-like permease
MARQLVDSRSAVSLVLASASWGIATVICKDLLSSVSPVTLLVIQLAPSVLLLWLLALIGRVQIPGWRTLLLLGLLGVLNPGVSYALSLVGLQRTTASVASLLWASEPVLINSLRFSRRAPYRNPMDWGHHDTGVGIHAVFAEGRIGVAGSG